MTDTTTTYVNDTDSITVRVYFDRQPKDRNATAQAVAEEIAAAFHDGDLRWRTTAANGGTASVVQVEAWPTRA